MAKEIVFLNNNSVANIDNNFQRVNDALEDVVARSGELPNSMGADLDMDGNDILNADTTYTRRIILDGEDILDREGAKGWSPVFGAIEYNNSIVMQLVDYVGGEGVKPTDYISWYVGETGYVENINEASLFGGAIITDGVKGDIVVSGNGSQWDILDEAVTENKILDAAITAAKITDDPAEQEAIKDKLGLNNQPSGELFKTVSLMLADNNSVVGYESSGAETEVVAGDVIVAEGFRYEVAASDADAFDPDTAPDGFHIETLGGVKLIYLADGLPAVEALTGDRYPENMADGLVLAVKIFNGARFVSELVNIEGATFDFQIRDLRIDASGTQIENLSETGEHCLIFEQMVNRFNIEIKRLVGGPNAGSNLKIGGATTGDLFGNGVLTIIDNETQNPAAHLVEFTENSSGIASCGRMTNVRLVGNAWRQPQNATVPAFYKDSPFGTLNNVRFSIMQHFCATDHPFYLILSRSAGGDYSHLVWDDMGVEYCLGGAIHLSGCTEARVGHVVSYDTNHDTDGVLRKDTLWFGSYNEYTSRFTDYTPKGSGTRSCYGVRSFGLARYGASSLPGTAPHSVVDVRFEDCRNWFIESVGAATSARNVRIACGSHTGTLIHLYNVTLQGYDAGTHLRLTP